MSIMNFKSLVMLHLSMACWSSVLFEFIESSVNDDNKRIVRYFENA